MQKYKEIHLVFNFFHLLRVFSLATLLLVSALALAVIPDFCADMKPVKLVPVLLWSAAVFALLMLWLYSKHRDPRQLMELGDRYTSSRFLHEPHFCNHCGTRRVLTIAGQPEKPVAPNTMLSKQKTSYYCPCCHDFTEAKNCIPASGCSSRLSPTTYSRVSETSLTPAYRPANRYIKLHLSLLLISLCFCAIAASLIRFHILFLPLWWAALYLLFLFSYHTLDNLWLSYQITSVGLLQRSISGFKLLRWEEINMLADISTQGNSRKMTGVFAQSENWILSPLLVGHDQFIEHLEEMCRKHRIPYYSPSDC